MTIEQNRATVQRVAEEIYNRGNLDIVDEVIAPDYVYHGPTGDITGRDGFRGMVQMLRNAFPDLHLEIKAMVAEGDMIALRTPYTGTHLGEYAGFPATGKPLAMDMGLFIRFRDGMQVEEWGMRIPCPSCSS